MELFTVLVALLLVAAVVAATRKPSPSPRGRMDWQPELAAANGLRTAKVLQVIDGDTLIVSANGQVETIRLDAIDCPESGQEWGDTARYGLIKLVGGRRVRYEVHDADRFGRLVATVYVRKGKDGEWMNVNARMITLGHAWVMRTHTAHLPADRMKDLVRKERWARSKQVGLWQEDNPVPPWEWRRNNDQESRSYGAASHSAGDAVSGRK